EDMALRPWKGGETYGGEDNLYFDEYRAKVRDSSTTRSGWRTIRTGSVLTARLMAFLLWSSRRRVLPVPDPSRVLPGKILKTLYSF
ncbi:hypothetical protein, partial [Streptomyces coeruleorubidus]|uniref:hypothetical protein n=1 Tax=Streptomyces coeruleorubidus TaxID=116188 RepID=UPI0033BEA9F9